MLRLRLASIPVEVHVTHVVFVPLLALLFSPRTGWAEKAPVPLVVLIGAAAIWGTLLIHELGHALAARAFGYRPVVQLVGMTARTLPNPNETMPWHRDATLHLAGPASSLTAGFTFAAAFVVMRHRVPAPLEYAAMVMTGSNLIWAGVNLLPVHPLDGGRIATAVLMRLFGRPGFLYAQLVGLFVGVVLAALMMSVAPLLGVFAILYLARTGVLIAAYRRGDLPQDATHPHEQAFAHAQALYASDNLDEALRVASRLAEADLQTELMARLQVLLGWLTLKLGDGQSALAHFARAGAEPVPPHALAAAHSLAGDDTRAVPLWEKAANASADPTLLHEWAGALLRLGREAEARALPGLHLPAAYQAAQRVLEQRGDLEPAARLAEARFALEPSAARAYSVACLWARANRADDALRLLGLAVQHGFSDLQRALHDDELSSVRAHAGFSAVLERLKTIEGS